MDSQQELESQLTRLLIGLSDQKIRGGDKFNYDGGELFAYDVGTIVLPGALCLADTLSKRLGMGGSGFEFHVGKPNPVFPIEATQVSERQFFQIAPFLAEVFEGIVYEMRHDLSELYVAAVQAMNLGLVRDVNLEVQDSRSGAPVRTGPEVATLWTGIEGLALER